MSGPRSIEKYIEDNNHDNWCECGQHRVQSKDEICPSCHDDWRNVLNGPTQSTLDELE